MQDDARHLDVCGYPVVHCVCRPDRLVLIKEGFHSARQRDVCGYPVVLCVCRADRLQLHVLQESHSASVWRPEAVRCWQLQLPHHARHPQLPASERPCGWNGILKLEKPAPDQVSVKDWNTLTCLCCLVLLHLVCDSSGWLTGTQKALMLLLPPPPHPQSICVNFFSMILFIF